MFERFSQGYYLGRLYVEPRDDEAAVMCREQHERVNSQLYGTGEGVERTDLPLVMKLGNRHFPVHGDEAVPTNTLAVPSEMLEDTRIRNPPKLREVFLARRERARQLLEFAGGVDEGVGDHPNAGT